MRYRTLVSVDGDGEHKSVNVDSGGGAFMSYPAEVGNPNYDAFLESQGLSDAEVRAMEPDEWHDLSAI